MNEIQDNPEVLASPAMVEPYGPKHPCKIGFRNATLKQEAELWQVHIGTSIYIWGCLQALDRLAVGTAIDAEIKTFNRWFGDNTPENIQTVRTVFDNIAAGLFDVQNVLFYDLDQMRQYKVCNQKNGDIAMSSHGVWTITLCEKQFEVLPFCGMTSKVSTIVHELTHIAGKTVDHSYKVAECMWWAECNDDRVFGNASSYQYYAAQTLPMSYKFDAATTDDESNTYITLGNLMICCKYNSADNEFRIEDEYPKAIVDVLPESRLDSSMGVDSLAYFQIPTPSFCFTKGNEVVQDFENAPTQIQPITALWQNLPTAFQDGFDALCCQLHTKDSFITKNDKVAICSGFDFQIEQTIVDQWPTVPVMFRAGFDAILFLDLYTQLATKDGQYVDLSDTQNSGVLVSMMGPAPANSEDK